MVKLDIANLSILEDEGNEQGLRRRVVELLRRGDMSAESQRWLADCFEPDRGRRRRGSDDSPQTKFRLEFKRRNGMKKSADVRVSDKTRFDVFQEACERFGGHERAINELVALEHYGGFTWSEATAKKCSEAILPSK